MIKTLSEEIYSIMSDTMKEILERTEGHKAAMNYLVNNVCRSCILAFTDTDYKKKNEKIAYFKKWAKYYTDIIDSTIQDFRHCEISNKR